MVNMTIADVIEATGCSIACGSLDAKVGDIVTDSRSVRTGNMLVCFPGERVDGNAFASGALHDGAGAVVMTREPDESLIEEAQGHGATVLQTDGDDATEFLLRLAAAWRLANPHWLVVGVTGSVGKTTTKELIAAALSAGMRVHMTEGNHNNLVGVPLTLLSASSDDDAVVVEMGMDHAGELDTLTHVVRPSVAVMTNIGTSHIGNLGSQEAIAHAKAEIVSGIGLVDGQELPFEPCLVITGDNQFADMLEDEYCKPNGVPLVMTGRTGNATWAEDVVCDEDGFPCLTVAFADGDRVPTRMCIPSRHVIGNLLIAAAVADMAGIGHLAAIRATEGMSRTGMRLDVVRKAGRPCVIDDSYNASPVSMAAALDALCSMRCDGRRVAVLGEIGELGDESEFLHGCVGAYVAAKPVDRLVLVGGEMADAMARAASVMGFPPSGIVRMADAEEACEKVIPSLEPSDLVLVKASRFVGLDVLARRITE